MAKTPLRKKLRIKPGHRVLLIGAPEGYLESLGSPPEGVTVATAARGKFDFVQLFVRSLAELKKPTWSAIRFRPVDR